MLNLVADIINVDWGIVLETNNHGCQDSGKPGKPGKNLEKDFGPGKPGKPGISWNVTWNF